jgi:hypothetical protein
MRIDELQAKAAAGHIKAVEWKTRRHATDPSRAPIASMTCWAMPMLMQRLATPACGWADPERMLGIARDLMTPDIGSLSERFPRFWRLSRPRVN